MNGYQEGTTMSSLSKYCLKHLGENGAGALYLCDSKYIVVIMTIFNFRTFPKYKYLIYFEDYKIENRINLASVKVLDPYPYR